MFNMKKWIFILPFLLIGMGLFFAGKSFYYYSKGIAASHFIENAWDVTKEKKETTKPWTWADFHPVAKLHIESIDLQCIIMNQISNEALTFGPGHLSSTSLPGQPGNIVIAGHRDGHFRKMSSIQKNDIISIEGINQSDFYIVTDITPTSGQDIYWTEQTETDVITLITCYPFHYIGEAEDRFIVRAEKMDTYSTLQ